MTAAHRLFVILVVFTSVCIYICVKQLTGKHIEDKLFESDHLTTKNLQYKVPNIVHYIWYSRKPTTWNFIQYLSILSASKFIRPSRIMFHTNCTPNGHYWNRTTEISDFEIIHRSPTRSLFGKQIRFPFEDISASDIDRLIILNRTGGIYLDTDVIALRSFDPLRVYSFTMGSESLNETVLLCGGIIISEPGSKFLKIWINNFVDDQRSKWAYNSGRMADKIASRFPEDIHIEMTSLNRPSPKEIDLIFATNYNWHNNYAIHLFVRKWKGHIPTEREINESDTTFGDISRSVLYGTIDLQEDKIMKNDLP
ncbi:unnamed protein product [Owenia fusiformis]|uniref:Uncharacterized protein n=1 Tax=Owenia fusiformis TaxID=6347 RepID=A0A8J1TFP7_OWEFU|nr:unnamed protein product [Owenia fusiformis]